MAKQILFSGIQPTGRLHIGNYLGALKNFVDLQDSGKYDCYFCIVDLHSLTGDLNPKEKPGQILDLAADFLAAGLDPKKSVVFQQSQISAHSELMWILNTITPIGELNRMTQFKEKGEITTKIDEETITKDGVTSVKRMTHTKDTTQLVNVGLFDYPVLMTADILLYDTQVVPVGDDQLQHLELARTVARKFNNRFGKTFIEPKGLLTKTPRVMSLKDPHKKMSKSQPEGCLFLDDSPEEIKSKIARAVTDSGSEIVYDPEKKPGLANLLDIYAAFTHMDPHVVAKEFSGQQYSALKKRLAEVVADYFEGFRRDKKTFLAKPKKLAEILNEGSDQAREVAEKKMEDVKKKVGLAL
jgi:tryptophanyl-tRNA synthetase